MNRLIKIIESDSQGKRDEADQVWCAVVDLDTGRTLCGDALDLDNLEKAEYKTVKRGGINCPLCLDVIKQIKAIKL